LKTWLKRGLIVFLLLIVAMAAVLTYFVYRMEEFQLKSGVSGAYLAARQATSLQDTSPAKDYLSLALYLDPDDLEIQRAALTAYLDDGDISLAASLAPQMLSDPEVGRDATLVLVVDAVKHSNYGEARDYLEKLPDGPSSRILKPLLNAWLNDAQGESSDFKSLEALLDSGAYLSVTSHQAAILLERSGFVDDAERAYERGIKSGGMGYSFFALPFEAFLSRNDRSDKAELVREIIVQRFGNLPQVRIAKANWEQGIVNTMERFSIQQHVANSLLAFVDALRADGHAEFARPYVHLARYLAPSARAELLLADMFADEEKWAQAAALYAEVGGDEAYRFAADIRRAEMHEMKGDVSGAVDILQGRLQSDTQTFSARMLLADIHRRQENYAAAELEYKFILSEIGPPKKSDWTLMFSLGMCRERLGRWPEAEANLTTARRLSDDNPLVLNYLAYSWIDKGINLDRARSLVEMAVKKSPQNGFYIDSLGWLYFKMGDLDRSILFLERATQFEPTDPVIADHLGDVLWHAKRETEARYQWRKALAFDPDDDLREQIEKKIIHGPLPPKLGGMDI